MGSQFVIFIILMHMASLAYAQSSQEVKARRADINRDSVIDKKRRK